MAGIFDGLMKGLSSLVPQVSDDPEMKIFNIQNELKGLEEKENGLFAALGRQVYGEGGEERFPETAVQLKALAANKAEAQQRLEAAQAEKEAKEKAAAEEAAAKAAAEAATTCPNCGSVNPEGTRFCQECGTKLGAPVKTFCTGCGAELKPGMRFCGSCGAKVGE